MESAQEHFDLIWLLLGFASTGLMGAGLFIFNGMKNDIKDVKDSLQKISDQLFSRVNKVEISLERLWGEHHATHEKKGAD